MKRITLKSMFVVILLIISISCRNESETPKPRGYFRISLPKHAYQLFDTISFPYKFEYPTYSRIQQTNLLSSSDRYWINIEYPTLNGIVYCSYKDVNDNLSTLINDSHEFVAKHIIKANSINEKVIIDPSLNKFGLIFELSGSETASPYQFYITDSTQHFFRAALYFNNQPNNDSLQPVIKFIKDDMENLIETFEWKHN